MMNHTGILIIIYFNNKVLYLLQRMALIIIAFK
jgi:hypothetical protein